MVQLHLQVSVIRSHPLALTLKPYSEYKGTSIDVLELCLAKTESYT